MEMIDSGLFFLRKTAFYAGLLRDIMAARFGVLKAPYKYIVVVTKKCNSRCRNCFIWAEKPENELTVEEYAQIARTSPGLRWLNLTGGEVTSRDDVREVVEVFKRYCPRLGILNFTTNGLDPERIVNFARELTTMGFYKIRINISLDGPKAVHDHLRGVDGNFEKVMATFGGLRALKGLSSQLSFTVYEKNAARFDEMIAQVQKYHPSVTFLDFHLNVENTSAHFYRNENRPRAERSDSPSVLFRRFSQMYAWMDLISLERILNWTYHRLAVRFLKTGRTPLPCHALESSVYISEKGTLFPCIIWNEPVGSLRDSGYNMTQAVRSEPYRATRRKVLAQQCPQCWTPCEAYQSIVSRFV